MKPALPDADAFLRYLDLPGAEPVRVFLHGLGFSSASLVHVATHPALAGRRSLLVDLLGFGLSDRPDGFGYTIEEHARTVIRLLDSQGVRGCELIGHSLGGSIAIVVAATRPDLVSSLVAAEANLDPGLGSMTGRVLAWSEEEFVRTGFDAELALLRAAARSDPESPAAATIGMLAAAAPTAVYRTARSLTADRTPTFRVLLETVDVPRSFLVGSETLRQETSPSSGEHGGGLDAAGVPTLVVPDAGHLMMVDNPDGFAATLAWALG